MAAEQDYDKPEIPNTEAAAPAAKSAPMDAEARRARLKNLIVLGKERGYLTYAEINDNLPEDMLDVEQIEGVIGMITDMGIPVYDEAPDAEQLLMSDATPAVADEDAVEEAEAALSTVDSEFGRTTDPVRMYMREMGTVELLTREGEIEIAKRIEDGQKHMILAISACPMTVSEMLRLVELVEKDELRVDELVDAIVDPNAVEEEEAEFAEPEESEELAVDGEEEDEDAGGAIAAANLEQLKSDLMGKFAIIRPLFDKMVKTLEKHGVGSKQYREAQEEILNELLAIRFTVKQIGRAHV